MGERNFLVYRLVSAAVVVLVLTPPSYAVERSGAARAAFQRNSPCPANGHLRGPCPGYQVDHIIPLKCGGPDYMDNMQWLTIEDHKIKTASESLKCRKAKS